MDTLARSRLSELIRRVKRANKFTQRQLAGIIGVNQTTIKNWEDGMSLPSRYTYRKLADYLNMSVEELDQYLYGDDSGRQKTLPKKAEDILILMTNLSNKEKIKLIRIIADQLLELESKD